MANLIFFILGLILGVVLIFILCALIIGAEADKKLLDKDKK